MIDIEALFKVSYGLYVVSSGDQIKGNGYISNTVFQVTANPPQFATCCSKDNYTVDFIRNSGAFAVSVLHQETSSDIFGRFGYKSGKDHEKLDGMDIRYGETGVPIVLNEAIAFLECKVVETMDLGTHIMYIGELIQSEVLDDSLEPITYLYYRNVKKAVAPKNAPTYVDKSKLAEKPQEAKPESKGGKQYKCPACGYIYDEKEGDTDGGIPQGTKFEDVPDNWVCPLCGTEKEEFFEV